VLRVKFIEGLFDAPYVDPSIANAAIGRPEAKAVALRAARESLVLLKNANSTLPLSQSLKHVLVCGPTAKLTETSFDRYGSNGGTVVSALEGIQSFLKSAGTEVSYALGCTVTDKRWPESELFPEPPSEIEAGMIQEAVDAAMKADAVIVCVGDSNATIGESKSRTSLDLPGHQTALVQALMKTGKPVVAVLMTGKPASINWIQRYVSAILEAWNPGEAGGTAIAEALFGDYNPGGRLPVTFPKSVGQLPFNFPFKPGSHATQSKRYDPNGFGDSMAEGALYPFGFGLSYTTFAYENITLSSAKITPSGELTVSCVLKNTGARAGDEVVQMYFHQDTSSVTTYELNLCGFERVHLKPGEARTVALKLSASQLELINRSGKRVVEPGSFKVMLGSGSEDLRLTATFEVE
jgi:beta-glucosidase